MQGPEVVEDTIFSCLLRYQLHGVQTANSFYESKQLHKILFLPSNTTNTLLPFSLSECNLKTCAATFPTPGRFSFLTAVLRHRIASVLTPVARPLFCETLCLTVHRHKSAEKCQIDDTFSGNFPQNARNETSVNLRRAALRAGVRAAWGRK